MAYRGSSPRQGAMQIVRLVMADNPWLRYLPAAIWIFNAGVLVGRFS